MVGSGQSVQGCLFPDGPSRVTRSAVALAGWEEAARVGAADVARGAQLKVRNIIISVELETTVTSTLVRVDTTAELNWPV